MNDLGSFPDIELAVVQTLADLATTGTSTPPNLASAVPFVRVSKIGGPDSRFIDESRVDVDAFGIDRPTTQALAEACRQRLLNVPHVVAAGRIDSVTTDSGPREIPWGDPSVRHFVASYTITARR